MQQTGKGASEEKIYENLWKCKDVWKDKVLSRFNNRFVPNDSEDTILDWGMRATSKESSIDYAMITELHLFPKWGKDTHWLNKMELNPAFYGYEFEEDGIQYTNNVGLTKKQRPQLAVDLLKNMDEQKKGKDWFNNKSPIHHGIVLHMPQIVV